jgi:hypothetical protein
MEPGHYTNPVEEALSHGSQRVAQLASLTGAMIQVVLQRRALLKAREAAGDDASATRILGEQERLLLHRARLGWAPAHDRQWLIHADLLQTGRAWAAAASCADSDPTAASAMRKCEDRLRDLHPYAMTRYDQLRADGLSPLDAMHKAAPFFAYPPGTRVGDPAPDRPALAASASSTLPDLGQVVEHAPGGIAEPGTGPDPGLQAELRGRQIIARLQSAARAAGRPEPGADELAMILEATTNLPTDVIDGLTQQAAAEARVRSEEHRATAAERTRTADLDGSVDLPATVSADERTSGMTAAGRDAGIADTARARASAERSAAQLAGLSFPASAADAVQATTTAQARGSARSPEVIHRQPGITERPGKAL